MTGYGKAEVILSSGCKMTVEIRTLNGKSADIGIKSQILPKDKELAIRSMIAQRLQRGTIDVYITLEQPAQVASHPINTELLKSYLDQVRAFEKEQGIAADATDAQVLATLLRFPDVLDAKKADAITEEDLPLLDRKRIRRGGMEPARP